MPRSPDKNTSTLSIANTSVEVTNESVPLPSLSLDPDNPRIRLQISHGGRKKPATNDEVLAIIKSQPPFEPLQKQVRKAGGVHEPLVIRHDGRIVEGNTRYGVLTVLSQLPGQKAKWSMVPVKRLPANVPERLVQLLMVSYHIAGKSQWRASAQAAQIYKLVEESNVPAQDVADAADMNLNKVEQYIEAYKFLVDEVLPAAERAGNLNKQEILDTKFSHAFEFIRGKKLEAIRSDAPKRKIVAQLIGGNQIAGAQVRELHDVMANTRSRQALKGGFKAAKEVLKKEDPTAGSKVIKKMENLAHELGQLTPGETRELFATGSKSREILTSLADALENVNAVALAADGRRRVA